MPQTDLLQRTARNPYTQASFRTLSKHRDSGAFDTLAALRLLRRNVRDVQPDASWIVQGRIANQLLQMWRDGATDATHITTE